MRPFQHCLASLAVAILVNPLFAAETKPPAGFEKVDVEIALAPVHGDIRFDKEELVVEPNQKVKIVFTNNDEMPHNIIICKPGTDTMEIGNMAILMGEAGLDAGYVPKSDKILWSLPMLLPGKTETLYFQAPAEKGVYPYVCTIPGHYIKMVGKLYVGEKPPPPKKGKNAPVEIVVHHKPYVYRTGLDIPNVGKRAYSIAVGLPSAINYVFDADTCELTAAWTGAFLDAKKDWTGRGGAGAEIMGKVFYTNKDHQTLSFSGSSKDKPVYKGYRLVDGFPVW